MVKTAQQAGFGSNVTQATRAPDQTMGAGSGAFGGDVARGLQSVGRGIVDAASAFDAIKNRESQEKDTIARLEVEQAVLQFQRDRFEGEGGIYSKKLKNAENVDEAFKKEWDKFSKGLMNDRQGLSEVTVARLNNYIEERGFSMSVAAKRHQQQQMTEYTKSLVAGRIADHRDLAISDPANIGGSMTAIEQSVKKLGELNQWDTEQVERQIKQEISEVVAASINTAIRNENIGVAQQIIKDHRDNVSAEKMAGIKASITQAVEKREDQIASGSVWDKFRDNTADAYRFIDETYEGGQRDRIRQRYRFKVNEAQEVERQERDNMFDAALEMAQDGRIDQITPDVISQLKRGGQWPVIARAYETAATGTQEVDNYAWLYGSYYNMTEGERMKVPADVLRNNLSFETYSKMMQQRKGQAQPEYTQTETQIIQNALRDVGLNPSETSDDEDKRKLLGQFHRDLEAELNTIKKKTGGSISQGEMRDAVGRLTADIDVDYGFTFWGVEDKFFNVTDDDWSDIGNASAFEVAPDFLNAVTNDLKAQPDNQGMTRAELNQKARGMIAKTAAQRLIQRGTEVNEKTILEELNVMIGLFNEQ